MKNFWEVKICSGVSGFVRWVWFPIFNFWNFFRTWIVGMGGLVEVEYGGINTWILKYLTILLVLKCNSYMWKLCIVPYILTKIKWAKIKTLHSKLFLITSLPIKKRRRRLSMLWILSSSIFKSFFIFYFIDFWVFKVEKMFLHQWA